MGFVPSLFKIRSVFLRVILISSLSLFASNSFATTKILVWGDSLSAAYGIPVAKGWVSLMETKLGKDFEVVNGSISGETTQGGLSRLPQALETHQPNFIILELGANDGLRGIPPQVTQRNLEQMIELAKQANAKVMLLGMKIPPNYGVVYAEKFEAQFQELASKYELPFVPFFLEGVIQDLSFFQADELHPTAVAQPIILDTIFPILKKALQGKLENIDAKKTGEISETHKNPA